MIRTIFCTLALICVASAGAACNASSQQTQSCAAGTMWDPDTQTCAEIVNS
ncbi:MAG: adenylosuccinate lyase [Pseudomonadota bacterium]